MKLTPIHCALELPGLVLTLLGLSILVVGAEDRVDFNYQIRPLLSDRCFACHGPDTKSRKAKLRLDIREGAFGMSTDGDPILKAGEPLGSALYMRISSSNPEERMPPHDSHLVLSGAEVDVIRRWIEQGAEWNPHWSFIPLKSIPRPQPRLRDRSMGPVDDFIFARLEAEGLEPSPRATKERLIRRVTFDLTGLPPTLDEIDAFLADSSADAYERVVDRLLASTGYGERMAVDWLDLARYADTHGYQADRYRNTWPWRDWVIDAFNRNLRFDEFITWQLAGDLLPEPTREQRLATAFNRHHMQTEEGGSVDEEFRVAYVSDRVNTLGAAFLGLTLECARCHDHKYDPVTQKEYYQLFSFFNNIDEAGQITHFTDSVPVPALPLPDAATERRLERLERLVRHKEAQEESLRMDARADFEWWLAHPPPKPEPQGLVGHFAFDELKDKKTPNRVDEAKPGESFEDPQLVPGRSGRALELDGENGVAFKGLGEFSRSDPFSLSLWIKAPRVLERAVVAHRTKAALDAGSRGYEILIEEGRVGVGLYHMWPHDCLKITSIEPLPVDEWVHLAVTYDGSSRARGLVLYWNGRPANVRVVRDHLTRDILYERVAVDLTIAQRFRDNGFKEGVIDEFRVYNRALSAIEISAVSGAATLAQSLSAAKSTDDATTNGLFEYYLNNWNPAYRTWLEELRAHRTALGRALDAVPGIMVMQELKEPRPAYVLARGAYDAPGDVVESGTPARILPFDERLPRNRLGLARWLLDSRNPLTARVAVNRFWRTFFGRGLVATPDDFGSQGALPTHPELLDWLASAFMESGWDAKALVRLIVTSAAYQQSSQAPPALLARDPENRLLARGPQRRLTAEMIRDSALAASGLLVRKVGGPSVKPYQPDGLWEEKSGAKYQRDTGEGLYRRSLYTFWKRTSPHPAMISFDASERNNCVAQRQSTSTPLQALVLLNDPQFVEASRVLARRAAQEAGPRVEDRLAFAFRLLTSRAPAGLELAVLKRMYDEQLELFESAPGAAGALSTVGDFRETDAAPATAGTESAALTVVASAIMNFDEAIMQR